MKTGPNQAATGNRYPEGLSDDVDNLSATFPTDRTAPAVVAELGRDTT